jgi:putative transposase
MGVTLAGNHSLKQDHSLVGSSKAIGQRRQREFRMKRKRLSKKQIVQIPQEADGGVSVPDLCWRYVFGKSSYYKWKARYNGMEVSDLKCLHKLEEENRRLDGPIKDKGTHRILRRPSEQHRGHASPG